MFLNMTKMIIYKIIQSTPLSHFDIINPSLFILLQLDVFVAMDYHKRSYGSFHGRVYLQGSSPMDASLVITEITLEDYGRYKCEVIDGLEDGTVVVSLDLEGK